MTKRIGKPSVFMSRLLCSAIVLGATLSACELPQVPDAPRTIEGLGIAVSPGENREFSYTDKESGYFYGRTHRPDSANWFAGWNVNRKRILRDYDVFLGGRQLDRVTAKVTVYPHKLVRIFPEAIETLRLFDQEPVLSIALDSVSSQTIALSLEGKFVTFDSTCGQSACFTSNEAPAQVIGVTTFRPQHLTVTGASDSIRVTDSAESGGFLIGLATNRDSLDRLLSRARTNQAEWIEQRESRMENLVGVASRFTSDDDSLTSALRWIQLTLDQLIMKQTGYGIYAGLPWFNDYWGRDLFITLPGATLVSGQFEVAASILRSFARYQNVDAQSPDFGRVPNRLRPDEIIYNTTDGTPRFVVALFDYLRYTGDTAILQDLYSAVERSIEGPLRLRTDERGYLIHEDADTWMDAKLDGRIPWSPRGNRAVDIQALWYQQLVAGAEMARLVGQGSSSDRWKAVAERVAANFERDFVSSDGLPTLADRLTADGTPDFSQRPNQLFALDLVVDDSLRMSITRHSWESLVYPWGVASLSQMDDNFHPYHENWEYYHKDAAYHNGTVWLWNNGIAMQRMLEADQIDAAYLLLAGMSSQALRSGAVGSLSENMDALPRPGKTYARRSGTFLQAWSNAEYLRVWYQFFLGVRPDALNRTLVLAPRIPSHLHEVTFRIRLPQGSMEADYSRGEDSSTYEYRFEDYEGRLILRLPKYGDVLEEVSSGQRVEIIEHRDRLELHVRAIDGSFVHTRTVDQDARALERAELEARIFDGVRFAAPVLRPDLKSLRKSGDR